MGEIIECVPNFSEGRNPEVIEAISAAIRSVPDVTLLDVDPGASTNRTVYTFVGNSSSVIQGALAAAKTARRLIDMTGHKGEHPRLGAMDVCPLIPVRGVTVEKCVAIARQLAELLAEELEVPIFLYGAAATRVYRKTVAQIRAGEYEGLKDKLKEEKWAPDFGPAIFDARWGATMVGVRKFLIAYNINLISTKEQAHRIALNIREAGRGENSPGRLKAVQGIGWWLEEANMAQVSLNLIDFDITPIHVAYEEVLKDAKELLLPVVGSEIVGLVPLRSILQVAEYYIEKEKLFVLEEDQKVRLAINRLGLSSIKPFVSEDRIIEYRLESEGGSGRPLISLSVTNFVKAIGARSSTPGGGSAAALVGAIGAALGAMVGQMTYGKRQYEHLDATMRPLITNLHSGFNKLLTVVDEDSAAFEEYKVAMKLPSNTEEEKCKRNEALQKGLKSAIDVPFNLATEVNKLWPKMVEMAKHGNMVTASDMQVGARCLEASVWGAYYNVCINLQGLTDAALKEEIQTKAEELVKTAQTECQSVLAAIALRQSNKK